MIVELVLRLVFELVMMVLRQYLSTIPCPPPWGQWPIWFISWVMRLVRGSDVLKGGEDLWGGNLLVDRYRSSSLAQTSWWKPRRYLFVWATLDKIIPLSRVNCRSRLSYSCHLVPFLAVH